MGGIVCDKSIRIAGDEFATILTRCSAEQGRTRLRALQREINKLQIALNGSMQKLEQEERDHGKANAALATAQTDRAEAEKKIEALKAQLNEKATDHKLAQAESAAPHRQFFQVEDSHLRFTISSKLFSNLNIDLASIYDPSKPITSRLPSISLNLDRQKV